jgi:hypothetical protein
MVAPVCSGFEAAAPAICLIVVKSDGNYLTERAPLRAERADTHKFFSKK